MTRIYSNSHRVQAAQAVFAIDTFWANTFAEEGMSDLNYCDLFTQMWLERKKPARPKSELYGLMPNISRRTAVKYVQNAIEKRLLIESEFEADRRIRLISLSPGAIKKIELFLDHTCKSFSEVGKSSSQARIQVPV